jgi:hypothetical protein
MVGYIYQPGVETFGGSIPVILEKQEKETYQISLDLENQETEIYHQIQYKQNHVHKTTNVKDKSF